MRPVTIAYENSSDTFEILHKDTQTNDNGLKNSEDTPKSHKLPLPRDLDQNSEGEIKSFTFSQELQDPGCPNSITIVTETTSDKNYPFNNSSCDFSNRYRYCKEVIKPFLKDEPPDCTSSKELLLKNTFKKTTAGFPDNPPYLICHRCSPPPSCPPSPKTKCAKPKNRLKVCCGVDGTRTICKECTKSNCPSFVRPKPYVPPCSPPLPCPPVCRPPCPLPACPPPCPPPPCPPPPCPPRCSPPPCPPKCPPPPCPPKCPPPPCPPPPCPPPPCCPSPPKCPPRPCPPPPCPPPPCPPKCPPRCPPPPCPPPPCPPKCPPRCPPPPCPLPPCPPPPCPPKCPPRCPPPPCPPPPCPPKCPPRCPPPPCPPPPCPPKCPPRCPPPPCPPPVCPAKCPPRCPPPPCPPPPCPPKCPPRCPPPPCPPPPCPPKCPPRCPPPPCPPPRCPPKCPPKCPPPPCPPKCPPPPCPPTPCPCSELSKSNVTKIVSCVKGLVGLGGKKFDCNCGAKECVAPKRCPPPPPYCPQPPPKCPEARSVKKFLCSSETPNSQNDLHAKPIENKSSSCSSNNLPPIVTAQHQQMECIKTDNKCKVKSSQEAAAALKSGGERNVANLNNSIDLTDSKIPDGKKIPVKVSNTHKDAGVYNDVQLDTLDAEEKVSANDSQQSDTYTRPDNSSMNFILDKIDSAVSMISDTLAYELPRPIKSKSFIEQNSEIPTASQPHSPAGVSNIMMGSYNLFSSIQDAIFSMFNEGDHTTVSSGKSSATSLASESDENILSKMID